MKRGRDDSDDEGTPVPEEQVARVASALLNARFYSRPIKGSTINELAPGADKALLVERVNDLLAEATTLEMVRIPERPQVGTKKLAPRNEYILRSRLHETRKAVLLKHAHRPTTILEGQMLQVVALVLTAGEVPEPQLLKTIETSQLATVAVAKNLIQRLLTSRLLEQRDSVVQGTKKITLYRVGPAASVVYTRKAMCDYLLKFMDYSEDTQTAEMLARNKQLVEEKVAAALPTARD